LCREGISQSLLPGIAQTTTLARSRWDKSFQHHFRSGRADAAALAGIFSRAVLHFPDNSGFNATAGTPPPVTPTVHTSAGMIKSNQPAAIYVCECVCALVRRLMVGMECSYLCLYFVGGIYFHIHTHSRARTRTHMYLHNSSLALVLYSSVLCAMQQE
jgi:hypothetical protein